jgi:dihydroorotate dehydrogenase (NAD+) catalytic subunit
MIELNISCPNVKAGGMTFGLDPKAAASVVEPVRRVLTRKPLMAKLSPNAPDLIAVANACVNSGADALSLVNTFKAMAIDIQNRRPVFDNISAGLSGPAIKPIALRMVWELCNDATVPVVGLGGIACADDALEFLMAGAAAVQVGSATFAHPNTMIEVVEGVIRYMINNKISTIGDISLPRTP